MKSKGIIEEYFEIAEQIRDLEKQKELRRQLILDSAKDGFYQEDEAHAVKIKKVSYFSVDPKALEEKYPEIAKDSAIKKEVIQTRIEKAFAK